MSTDWENELDRPYNLTEEELQLKRSEHQELEKKIRWYEEYDLFAEQKKRNDLVKKKKLLGIFFISDEEIRKLKEAENTYQEFDINTARIEFKKLCKILSELEDKLEAIIREQERIRLQLKPLIDEYWKLVFRQNKKDLNKCRRRILSEIHKLRNDVKTIVIDGKNVCHYIEGDDKTSSKDNNGKNSKINKTKKEKFAGLAPLVALVEFLVKNGYKVKVFLDPSIISDIQTIGSSADEQMLKNAFKDIDMIITPGKADPWVLDAAEEESAWIISNDKYSEYVERKVVKERRIFRHKVFPTAVYIPALDFHISYQLNK